MAHHTAHRRAAGLLAAAGIATAVAAGAPAFGQSPTDTECGTYSGRGCAPASARVDLAAPVFSDPTKVTNPLFPISSLHSALLLGQIDGKPFRAETTLLPGTKTVEWAGQRVEALASQYHAYLDGRITEVATDWYAQADDGSVWYLGEDVFDYENGSVVTTEGTWLAGRDGPAAMIMPAAPKVGDVFRPENVLGIVFEEVRVRRVGRTVRGPRGPVDGAIVTEELHLDGSTEGKVFAPGYGEFSTGSGRDLEALALAVPTDALEGEPPAALVDLRTAATGMLGSSRAADWPAARATLRRLRASWATLRRAGQPPLVAARLGRTLKALARAVRRHRPRRAAQAAIDAGQSALDLQLRNRPPVEIDVERFALWSEQVLVHSAARDRAGVRGAVATLEWIRDRIAHTLDAPGREELDARLRALRAAADAGNLAAAGDHAVRLAARLRGRQP